MKEEVEVLEKVLLEYDKEWKRSLINWDIPESINADLSLNILAISKKKKVDVIDLAKEIICKLYYYFPTWTFTSTDTGFINIKFSLDYYHKLLTSSFWQNWDWKKKNKEERVIIEYVSANPTGFLHLAHFRQAFVGSALANIYEFQGYKVTREYYVNDRGKQIEDLTNSVYYYYHQLLNVQKKEKKEEEIKYPGTSSHQAALFLKRKWKDRFLKLNKKGSIFLRKEILAFMLRKIRLDLGRCRIFFDKWTSEEDLFQKNKCKIRKTLLEWEKKQFVFWSNNSLFFKSTLNKDDKDRVLIKSNKEYTYFFNDIFYHQEKLSRAERLITVLGPDHHGYIQRLLNACYLLLNCPNNNITVIMTEMINLLLPEGNKVKFSKRIGNTISLTEALKHIQIDQLRFFCLEKDHKREININEDILKEKQEKTPLYYIRYAIVRCFQIVKRVQTEEAFQGVSFDFQKDSLLKNGKDLKIYALQTIIDDIVAVNIVEKAERNIWNLISQFSLLLEDIILFNRPYNLVNYLLKLSKNWQAYYQRNIIFDKNELWVTKQRICLTKMVQITLCLGLRLLGFDQVITQM